MAFFHVKTEVVLYTQDIQPQITLGAEWLRQASLSLKKCLMCSLSENDKL